MEGIQEKKLEIRNETGKRLDALSDGDRLKKNKIITERLFDFANFLEAKISLLYMDLGYEVKTREIIKKCFNYNKVVVLPTFAEDNYRMKLMKIDNFDSSLRPGPRGVLEPNPARCKLVPIEQIDIAIIPGIAFDEKGGRIGSGKGYYDRLIPDLAITTRKVALAFEEQLTLQVPMESHDKHVDIIITDERIIYKI
ncbi:MAG: 5-formyltetrahydrofolate cyclo-ligase [Desulfobacterales bacterium]|nr:5-formyltetrahydrofolate cyclo-ligase [Desulfobacterales bacterium]